MTSKFLFVGDVHLSDAAPSKRKDTYQNEIFVKLTEIVDISKQQKVDFVVFAGDMFHHKEPRKVSHRSVQALSTLLRDFGVPVYIVVGNHDITNGRLESLEKQPLGVVGQVENVKLLTWNAEAVGDIALYPIPGVSEVGVKDYAISKLKGPKWHFVVSHQSVVPDKSKEMPILQNKPFIHDATEVARVTKADVVLYGHQHRRDGIYERGGKRFVNLGSICRGTIGDEDLNKKPAVLFVEAGDTIELSEIFLKNVRPSSEVFRLDDHYEAKAHKKDIEDAIAQLNETTVQDFSIEGIIRDIDERDDIATDVRERALFFLEQVR